MVTMSPDDRFASDSKLSGHFAHICIKVRGSCFVKILLHYGITEETLVVLRHVAGNCKGMLRGAYL